MADWAELLDKAGVVNKQEEVEVKVETNSAPVEHTDASKTNEPPPVSTNPYQDKINALKTALSVENDDELIGVVESYKQKVEAAKQLEVEHNELRTMIDKAVDPSSYFSSPDAYKREQLLKARPDLSVDVAEKVVSSDVSALQDKEVIKLDLRMKYPSLKSDADLEEYINDKYGIEEGDEPSNLAKNKMMIDASTARAELARVRSELTEPEKLDLSRFKQVSSEEVQAKARELEQAWAGQWDSIAENKTVSIKDKSGAELISYAIDDAYLEAAKQDAIDLAKRTGAPVNEQSKALIRREVEVAYTIQKLPEIVKAAQDKAVTDYVAKLEREKAGITDVSRERQEQAATKPSINDGLADWLRM